MTVTSINAPVRIGRAVVLPGDLVLAKTDGVIFIPAVMAEGAVSHAEFTNLMDDYNFELNREGKNGAEFEGGWTPAKFQGLSKWIDAHPEKLKMPRSEFDALLADAVKPADGDGRPAHQNPRLDCVRRALLVVFKQGRPGQITGPILMNKEENLYEC